jgi:hypothetical protein
MKAKKVDYSKDFSPIKIEIVIDSKEELLNLWARHELGTGFVDVSYEEHNKLDDSNDRELFEVLDAIKDELGL